MTDRVGQVGRDLVGEPREQDRTPAERLARFDGRAEELRAVLHGRTGREHDRRSTGPQERKDLLIDRALGALVEQREARERDVRWPVLLRRSEPGGKQA